MSESLHGLHGKVVVAPYITTFSFSWMVGVREEY